MKRRRLVSLLAACITFTLVFTWLLASCSKSVSSQSIEAFNKSEGIWYQYKLKEAKTSLEEIMKKDPNYADVSRKLAFIEYYYYQNHNKALEYIQKALKEQPEDAQNHTVSGDIYYAKGQYEKAIASYEKALELDSKNTNIHYSMAQSYLKLSKEEEAMKILEEGNSINPFETKINNVLHLQYVKDGEYDKAYEVWSKGNACDIKPVGYYAECNELYRKTFENNAANSHAQLADMYIKLLLYDEAKLELEKALKDDSNNNNTKKKLNEISLFVKFRDDMSEYFEAYHRRRIINGVIEETYLEEDVENIYKQMMVLFPDIEYNSLNLRDYRKYTLNNEIQKKFHVIIDFFPVDGYFGCYFWYVVNDTNERISHWGKEADMRVIVVKNPVVNSFWSWYHKIDGTGGWSLTAADNSNRLVYISNIALDSKFKMAYDLWEGTTNKEKRKSMLDKAEENDKHLFEKPALEVFYSSFLSLQLQLKAMDELIEEAKTKFDSEEEIKSYVISHLVYDVMVPLTYLHEGQHLIDAAHYKFEPWEREYRAMISEPVYGELQLQDITSHLQPDIGDLSTAYGIAHTKIFTDMIIYISNHKEDYPVIDTNKNIMMQLSKLSSNDIKEIAKNVFEQVYPGQRYE